MRNTLIKMLKTFKITITQFIIWLIITSVIYLNTTKPQLILISIAIEYLMFGIALTTDVKHSEIETTKVNIIINTTRKKEREK